jgi:hypothetical protein
MSVFLLAGATLISILFSCKKDPYSIGLDLLPPTDTLSLHTIDTATVVAYSLVQDSIRTDKTTTNMVGSLVDPVFGTTTANFCTQLQMATEAPDFGQNPVLDSLILMLKYDTIYGDTNAFQRIRVYELAQDIFYDSAYYSNQHVSQYGDLLADYTFRPDLKDSVTVVGGKLAPHLRINLGNISHYFANKLLYAPASVLLTNTAFVEYMKGLYIETVPVTSGGALVSFKMDDILTKMILYFHNEDVGDSLHFDFSISTSCARANFFDHNYLNASPAFRNQVIFHDTTLGQTSLYLQGLGGVRIKVRLPHLKDFNKLGKIAINNAILVFKNQETDITLAPPPQLNMFNVDSTGALGIIVDSDEGASFFDGYYSSSSRSYKFRITRQVQNILEGKIKQYDMYIMVNNPVANELIPGRVVVNGTHPTAPYSLDDRIQLQVTYTKLY